MMGLSTEALSAPPVLLSADRASSGGQSVDWRSCESRPFEMPSSAASAVRDIAPGRPRYVSSVMDWRLDYLNDQRNDKCLAVQNDDRPGDWYLWLMAEPRHDWYLAQWLKTLGKRQADVARDLDWNKARVSLMARGEQPYTRDAINEVAEYLNLQPYELLMHPEEAMRIRRWRTDMIRLAHENEWPDPEGGERKVSLG
jgi:transcriptional regulator with XRE-family HTH domain